MRRDVFISHTAELDRFPPGASFISAAVNAVLRSGKYPVRMSDFGARNEPPAKFCEDRVRQCDVFVGIIGFRSGSDVSDQPHRSYTELEYDAAVEAQLPRLIFLLDEQALIPLHLVDHDRARVDNFRKRLQESGNTTVSFMTADGLEAAVTLALANLDASDQEKERQRQQTGAAHWRPWMAPLQSAAVVPRTNLLGTIVHALTSPDDAGPVALTTALAGAGGFGKTTLAATTCHRPEIKARFPGGLLWVTLGEQVSGPALAEKVNDLCEVLSGQRPALSDPEQSGFRLAELLEKRRDTLVVIDDVWLPSQLRPFMLGAPNCRFLITTRNRGVLPAESHYVVVDTMESKDARKLLGAGISDPLSEKSVLRLLQLTGRWPVLLALVNAAIRRMIGSGVSADAAPDVIIDRLNYAGPAAVDLRRSEDRASAVRATVEASLNLLTDIELDCYIDLSIFPEDIDIPLTLLRGWWAYSRGLGPFQVDSLCDDLSNLSLIGEIRWSRSEAVLRLHDVVREYLRHRDGRTSLVDRNQSLLGFAAGLVHSQDEAGSEPGSLVPWWSLPENADYLWRHLAYHIKESGQGAELERTVCDLRWVAAKIQVSGHPVGVETDLALIGTETARELAHALAVTAHLLTPLGPEILDTLLVRIAGSDRLAPLIEQYEVAVPRPRLKARWPLPDRPHPALRRTLEGHRGWIRSCTYSTDGTRIASAGDDRTIRIWDAVTGQHLLTLAGHTGPVRTCAFFPEGDRLVSAGDDGTVRIWDLTTGRSLASLAGHVGRVRGCTVASNGLWLASAGDDGTVRIWESSTQPTARTVLYGHDGPVRGCFATPDGSSVVSCGDDGTVRVWDVSTGAIQRTFVGHLDWVNAITLSADGEQIGSVSDDLSLRIWEMDTGELLTVIDDNPDWIYCCAFASDDTTVAIGIADGTVSVWNKATQERVAFVEAHDGGARSCSFSPDGRSLVTGGDDSMLRIWDVQAVRDAESSGRVSGLITCACSPDGSWLVTGGEDSQVRVWTTSSGDTRVTVNGHADWVRACAVSADGQRLLSVGDDGRLLVSDAQSGIPLMTRQSGAGMLLGCAISPNGEWIATSGNDGTVRVWEAASGALIRTMTGHAGWVTACAVSPDGEWVVSSGNDGTVRVWEAASGALIRTMTGHAGPVTGCAISADGHWIASVSEDRTIRVWEFAASSCSCAVRVEKILRSVTWRRSALDICTVGEHGIYLFSLAL